MRMHPGAACALILLAAVAAGGVPCALAQERRSGDSPYVISITSNTLQPGDEKRVAQRLKEILKPASERARKG